MQKQGSQTAVVNYRRLFRVKSEGMIYFPNPFLARPMTRNLILESLQVRGEPAILSSSS